MTRRLLLGGLLLALVVPLAMVVRYERLAARAEPLLLPLAPRDPRSLIQGDFMVLRYRLSRDLEAVAEREDWPRTGRLVVTVDEQGVVTEGRRAVGEIECGPDEHLLRYRRADGIQLGAESFFFQEGNADAYAQARYGELRVAPDGTALLVGLRDADRAVLGPAGDHPLQ